VTHASVPSSVALSSCLARLLALVRSTVGLVLSGVTVKMVVPGSPSSRDNNGNKLEPGDVVTHIDGEPVDKHSIVHLLRGNDVPGTEVTVTVHKHTGSSEMVFRLKRADAHTVMATKNLYLALGDVHAELEKLEPRDPQEHDALQKKLELVELNIEAVTSFAHEEQANLQAHVSELEDALRGALLEQERAAKLLEQERATASNLRIHCASLDSKLKEKKSLTSDSSPSRTHTPPQVTPHSSSTPRSTTRTPRLSRDLPSTIPFMGAGDLTLRGVEKRVLSNGVEIWVPKEGRERERERSEPDVKGR